MKSIPGLVIAATLLNVPLLAGAQAVFHAETRLVVVQVTVRNGRGDLVTGLDRTAFTVYENGAQQPITLFRRDDIPVSLGLVIDNSGSIRPLRSSVEAAALAFARASNPDDEVFVLNFADKSRLDVPLTHDLRVLEQGISRVDSIGGTAMWDALDAAGTYLTAHARYDRKVLLVITDGGDNASLASVERVGKEAQQRGIAIYAIGLLKKDPESGRARQELDRITADTGGAVHYPEDIADIDRIVLELAHQIRTQYTIAYTPLNQALDGSYRTIRVAVKGEGRLAVRTRAGYWATAVK